MKQDIESDPDVIELKKTLAAIESSTDEVAAALCEAKEKELWKEGGYASFEEFYTKEFGFSKDNVDQLLSRNNINTLFKTYGKTN